MSLTSLRDLVTALETKLDQREAAFRQMLEQRDDAFRQSQARIAALEILTHHLKPKQPGREPMPSPGPGDPPRVPRKNVRRMVVADDRVTGPNGQHAVGCAYCGKLLCSSLDPKCERAKRMVGWRA